ncbi:UNVERIFIED_CONTAM: hypothetical protein GTU68_000944 [Idotea baltica]|nr:hypothetical protein [Idotea baltica]
MNAIRAKKSLLTRKVMKVTWKRIQKKFHTLVLYAIPNFKDQITCNCI